MKRLFSALILATAILGSCCSGGDSKTDAQQAAIDNIMARKSVRSYTDQQVPDEMIETMLRAAMAAPTAMNVQPWAFVVLKDREVLDALAGKLKYAKMLQEAPLAIVVCAEAKMVDREGNMRENIFWQQDASAATENLLLAAEALGLGAVWTAACEGERAAAVREALNLPENVMPLCVVPIGFPAGDEQPKDKWKPEKIHYNVW
jgi:Nitroreductase